MAKYKLVERSLNTPLNIVVPVFNEADNFPALWKEISSKVHCEKNVFVVYDFDEDTTVPVVKELIQAGASELQLIRNCVRRGVVGAIQAGFAQARTGPVLVVMADLSDDMGKVDDMVGLYRKGYDIVVGSRYMKGGGIEGGPPFKQFLSRLAGVSLYYLRGLPTHDATNAFKLYDSEMLRSISIESIGGFEINLEITVKAFLHGHSITEIPTVWHDRVNGESRFRLWNWLPRYLRWYSLAFSSVISNGKGHPRTTLDKL